MRGVTLPKQKQDAALESTNKDAEHTIRVVVQPRRYEERPLAKALLLLLLLLVVIGAIERRIMQSTGASVLSCPPNNGVVASFLTNVSLPARVVGPFYFDDDDEAKKSFQKNNKMQRGAHANKAG